MLSTAWMFPPVVHRRAIGVNLVLLFAFALTAVIFLSRSIISAAQIDSNVAHAIKPATTGIHADTVLLPALDKTVKTTDRIAESVAPLHGDLAAIVTATASINRRVASITQGVGTISSSVTAINGSVATIRAGLARVQDAVAAIRSQTRNIDDSLAATAQAATAIDSDAARSNTDLGRVDGVLAPLRKAVTGIRGTLTTINGHVIRIQDAAILRLTNLLDLRRLLGNLLGGH